MNDDKSSIEMAFEWAGINPTDELAYQELAIALAEDKFEDRREVWTDQLRAEFADDVIETSVNWHVTHELRPIDNHWPANMHIARRLKEMPRWSEYSIHTLRRLVAGIHAAKQGATT